MISSTALLSLAQNEQCVHTHSQLIDPYTHTRHELLLSRLTFSISHRDGIFSHSCNVRTSVLRNTYLPYARRVQTITILCKRKYWIVLLADLYTYNRACDTTNH